MKKVSGICPKHNSYKVLNADVMLRLSHPHSFRSTKYEDSRVGTVYIQVITPVSPSPRSEVGP